MKHPLQAGEDLAAAVQKTPHRVTLADLEAKVVGQEYLHPAVMPHMTICILILANGFSVIGTSAPADPANFDEAAGREFARSDALKKVWPLEGYLLREKLAAQ